MEQFRNGGIGRSVALAAICLAAVPALAGYIQPGYDLQVVKSEQGLDHAVVSYLTNPTWVGSGRDVPINTTFTLPSCQDIGFARLYLDIWGGTSAYTCTVTTSVNGAPLADTPITISGTGDNNPAAYRDGRCTSHRRHVDAGQCDTPIHARRRQSQQDHDERFLGQRRDRQQRPP